MGKCIDVNPKKTKYDYLSELQAFGPFFQSNVMIVVSITGIEERSDAVFQGIQWSPQREELVPRDRSKNQNI